MPYLSKVEALEKEVKDLRAQLQENSRPLNLPIDPAGQDPTAAWPPVDVPPFFSQDNASPYQPLFAPGWLGLDWTGMGFGNAFADPLGDGAARPTGANGPPRSVMANSDPDEEIYQRGIENQQLPDLITTGMLTLEQAEVNVAEFFKGCGTYFPFLDPKLDSVERLRSRSTILFNTVCAVGCRARRGGQSQSCRVLNHHVSRMHDNLATTRKPSLETIQALLIRACYSSERTLIISIVARLAFELDLPNAFDQLTNQLILGRGQNDREEHDSLLQKARTWLSILVMRMMLGVDVAGSLDKRLNGDARRYRVLLDKPFSTELDLCLIEQLELNVLLAKIYKSLTDCMGGSEDGQALMDAVRDARIDIEVWFIDWNNILNSRPKASWLRIHLEVQRHWANITTLCWAVHASNGASAMVGEYGDTTSFTSLQKELLMMTKTASLQHFLAIIADPRQYIHNLKYATDFVWAKFVFCFLLLLDLSKMVPDQVEDDNCKGDGVNSTKGSTPNLLVLGDNLLEVLAGIDSISTGETCSRLSQDYVQILQKGIRDYARCMEDTVNDINAPSASTDNDQPSTASEMVMHAVGSASRFGESFVPAQFAFEWNFPCL